MAFVKLDTGILDSTLWLDRDLREVFITALLMAQPCEFSESQQQIEVDSLKTTDFFVPPGWYGFVQAAGVGIVNRAGVPRESGIDALRKLGEPELESRSKQFEGRRMVRVNGGYIILNFMQYRDKDHTAGVRAKNLRFRKKVGIDAMLKDQDYKCDCCESRFTEPYRDSVVQNRHMTSGENRGLVCPSCNIVVGQVETGANIFSPKKQLCIAYIERYGVTSRENGVTTRNVTQAEAEAYTEKTIKHLSFSRTDQAERLYELYPRKVGKVAAIKAIEKSLRLKTFDELESAVTQYSKLVEKRGTEKQYIPHPATWFNQGRYDDEDLKPKSVSQYVEVSPEEWWGNANGTS